MKRVNTLFTLFFLSLLTIQPAFGQEVRQPDPERQAAWQAFKNGQGGDWTIRWNERTGLPRTITHGKSKAYVGSPENAARAFLIDQARLFGMKSDLTDLQHTKTTQSKYGLRRITFHQEFEGVPVEGAEYKIHLFKDGRVGMANGTYYPNIELSVTPNLNSYQAVNTAIEDLELSNPSGESHSAELVVLPLETGGFALAWKTLVFAEKPFTDWLYFIDARSGEILKKQNQIMATINSPGFSDIEHRKVNQSSITRATPFTTGTAKVYLTHPGLSASTPVKNLYRLSGNGTLVGTYVNVLNDELPQAQSGSHNFQYSTSNTHFDEANLYYHIDDFRHNFIANLGSLSFNQVIVYAHYNSSPGPNDAWFSPGDKRIRFGDGTGSGFNDFAREDKVIYHEYSHRVIYDINSGISSAGWDEEGAISEGTPDYFAGSYKSRAVINEYAATGYIRDMNNPDISSYSEYIYEKNNVPPYGQVKSQNGGEFFSSILWSIRNHAGISVAQTDYLVFEALNGITGNPDFLDFRDAMMTADDDAYSGSHNDIIQNAFADKGIGSYAYSPLSVYISGSGHISSGSSSGYTAVKSGGTGPYSYQWKKDGVNVSTSSSYTLYTLPIDEGPVLLSVTVTDDDSNTDTDILSVFVDPYLKRANMPTEFSISENYPNPFNPSTKISFALPEESQVSLSVYNMMGQKVATLASGSMSTGYHETTFNASGLASGLYIARIEAVGKSGNTFSKELKMQLIK